MVQCLHVNLLGTNSALAFLSSHGQGFQVRYPSITLHAISRADSSPSIYCQLDETPEDADPAGEEITSIRELRIIPEDVSARERSPILHTILHTFPLMPTFQSLV
jgi:nucleotide-sensitive chloride channel 1A